MKWKPPKLSSKYDFDKILKDFEKQVMIPLLSSRLEEVLGEVFYPHFDTGMSTNTLLEYAKYVGMASAIIDGEKEKLIKGDPATDPKFPGQGGGVKRSSKFGRKLAKEAFQHYRTKTALGFEFIGMSLQWYFGLTGTSGPTWSPATLVIFSDIVETLNLHSKAYFEEIFKGGT